MWMSTDRNQPHPILKYTMLRNDDSLPRSSREKVIVYPPLTDLVKIHKQLPGNGTWYIEAKTPCVRIMHLVTLWGARSHSTHSLRGAQHPGEPQGGGDVVAKRGEPPGAGGQPQGAAGGGPRVHHHHGHLEDTRPWLWPLLQQRP